jgi:hypothetical protein
MVCGNRVFRAVIPLVAALTWAGGALAEEVAPREGGDDSRLVTTKRWYGWQTLAVDAVPASLFLATIPANDAQEPAFWILGSLSFALGGPSIHIANGRPLAALGSFGLRLALPFIGMAAGVDHDMDKEGCGTQPDTGDESSSCDDSTILGGLLGAAVASAFDASLVAYELRRHPRYTARAPEPVLTPSFEVRSGGARLTLRASF